MTLLILAFMALLTVWPLTGFALCVKADVANLRSGPGTRYERVWQVYKYMPFRKVKRKRDWILVRDVDRDESWIHKNLVSSSFKCAVVKSNRANLRSGPGTRYRKVRSAERYVAFKYLKRKGDWIRVLDEFGDRLWVHRSLVWIN